MTENELKSIVLRYAYDNGWSVYHVPQATMRNGGGKGYPDLTLARDGEALWIELKRDDGTLTHEQLQWRDCLPSRAWHCVRPANIGDGTLARLLG